MKVVINKCYGGFGLSSKAEALYAEKAGIKIYRYSGSYKQKRTKLAIDEEGGIITHTFTKDFGETMPDDTKESNKYYWSHNDIDRNDPFLVQVVEELGEEANSSFSILQIVNVPDNVNWYIEEYDGNEWVAEQHNTWG